jgi:hypothetical protein
MILERRVMSEYTETKCCFACRQWKPVEDMQKEKISGNWFCKPCLRFKNKMKRMTPAERDRYLDSLKKS